MITLGMTGMIVGIGMTEIARLPLLGSEFTALQRGSDLFAFQPRES